jgi:acyl transferase domain-containing protein
MACLFPGSADLDAYWRNILAKVDCVTDPPPEAWDPALLYDPDTTDTDRVYCKRGGYLGPLAFFDPLRHGIPPNAVGGEPDQWLALQLARDALADAGYSELDPQVRSRTAVVMGKGTYLNHGNLTMVQHGLIVAQTVEMLRALHPEYSDADLQVIRTELKRMLPRATVEVVPGLIPNIIVGRIANRLDLMGPSHTVDAACASSLVATQLAVRDLMSGEIDLALVGGSQVSTPVPLLNVFCQLNALSHREQIRPFDKDADGTLLGEGIGMMVLKRLADAEQAGDRIYAVIRGVGVASDGHGASVMAPRLEGEELALRRAYAMADVAPDSVELIEAHGTGTPVGDVVEVQALTAVFGQRDGGVPHVALGTVKSMISHTMPAAGIAGLIKSALALHHRILPPTLNVEAPNPKLELEKTPFYLNTETRPWIHGAAEPRRAAVNAFGFGGINAHVVLEEYAGTIGRPDLPDHMPAWDVETCVVQASTRAALIDQLSALAGTVEPHLADETAAPFTLADLAYSLALDLREGGPADSTHRLTVVASTLADLHTKVEKAIRRLAKPDARQIKDASGVFYFEQPLGRTGKVVALFPGEGSQYANMLADLCLYFPEVRSAFDETDRVLASAGRDARPSDIVFPPTLLTSAETSELDKRLWQMDGAVDAVLAANHGLWQLLVRLGFKPDAMLGHSTGEFSALRASGTFQLDEQPALRQFATDLSDGYQAAVATEAVTKAAMLALGTTRDVADDLIAQAGSDGLYIGMDNCPHQSVIVGDARAVDRARLLAQAQGLLHEFLAFDRAYHTPLFEPYVGYLRDTFARTPVGQPRVPVWSCTSVGEYPTEPTAVRTLAARHWMEPVEFRKTIERLYAEGARVFVEVGARGALSAFLEDTLRGQAFCAIPTNVQRRSGISQINHCVAMLVAHGVELDLAALFRARRVKRVAWREVGPPRAEVSRKQKLMTGFPFMRLSEEFAGEIRNRRGGVQPSVGTPQARADAQQPLAANGATEAPPHSDPLAVSESPRAAPLQGASLARPDANRPAYQPRGAASAVDAYLATMDQFLATQETIMRSYLGGGAATPPPSAEPQGLPLLGEVLEHTPGQSLLTRRVYDPNDDLYLKDHTLGRNISDTHPDLLALAVMPLTMSLEIVAEAAAALAPGEVVVGMDDVLANRWIAFDGYPQTLQVAARRLPPATDGLTRIAVQLRNLTEDSNAADPAPSPVLQTVVRLASSYPAAPPARFVPAEQQTSSMWQTDGLYTVAMFHGPLWQGVESVDTTGPGGTSATFRVLPFDHFFREIHTPAFAVDPAMLDAAGQVIGFWVNEHFPDLKQIFPFRLQSLDVFGPLRSPGERLLCHALIRSIDNLRVVSDIDMTDAGGELWMRLIGWEDKRFSASLRLHPLVYQTRQAEVSYSWPAALGALATNPELECRVVVETLGADRAFWKLVWGYCVLGTSERKVFQNLAMTEPEQVVWLAGRTAAKETVRALLARTYGVDVPCADIEITSTKNGGVAATGGWQAYVDRVPRVAICDRQGFAAAVAWLAPADVSVGLGFDLDVVVNRPYPFVEQTLTAGERVLLGARLPMDAHLEWVHRIRSAKQATARALGLGTLADVGWVIVRDLDVAAGTITLALGGHLAELFPGQTTDGLVAHTRREGDIVVATILCSIGYPIHATYV